LSTCLGSRELLDLLDPRVLRVHLALLEPLVDLAEAMVATVLLPLPLLLLYLVLPVLQVLLVPQERRVMLELQDRMVLLVDLEIPAPLAVMVLPAHKDPLAPMEPQETPADQVLLDLKENPEPMVLPEPLVLEPPVETAIPALLVLLARRVKQVLLESLPLVAPDLPELLVNPERMVLMACLVVLVQSDRLGQ